MQVLVLVRLRCADVDFCFSRLELEEIARRTTTSAAVEEPRVGHLAILLAAIRQHGALAYDGARALLRSRLQTSLGCPRPQLSRPLPLLIRQLCHRQPKSAQSQPKTHHNP